MEKKSMLPDIFSLIGNLFTAVIVFVGLIYILNGNLWLSGFICLALMIINYVLPERLSFFKSRKTKRPERWQEITILVFYTMIAVSVFVVASHFINIDLFKKDAIKNNGEEKLQMIEQLKTDYTDAIEHKKNQLNTSASQLFSDYQLEATKIDSLNKLLSTPGKTSYSQADLDAAISSKKNIMGVSLDLDTLLRNNNFEDRMAKAKDVFENWRFLKLNYSFNDVDAMYNQYLTAAKTIMPDFNHNISIAENINLTDPINTLSNGGAILLLLSIGIMGILNLCILAPYISAKRYESGLQPVAKTYGGPKGIEL